MGKKIRLTIQEPCHENWDGMTPAEKGRFCDACQKQVIDFSVMSDTQVAAFFKRPSTGSVCGRFMADQLDRDVVIPKKRIPWLRYFFQIAIPAFLASSKGLAQSGKPAAVLSQVMPAAKSDPLPQVMGFVGPSQPVASTGRIAIRGRVVDEKGNPVPYATVVIKESGFGREADSAGAFLLAKTLNQLEKTLVVSSAGFETAEVAADTYNGKNPLLIQLAVKPALRGVEVVGYSSTGCLRMVTGAVSVMRVDTLVSIEKQEDLPLEVPVTNVYPNPVQAGTSLTIDCKGMEEDAYTFILHTISGQQLCRQEAKAGGKAVIFNMPVPAVAPGTYVLAIINRRSGKRSAQKIIIR
ncbi:MAG: carboxypeptidase-like regulatory domain-containing protein [Chitinophagaceae bacterium]